jgi:hypothetical protein
MSTRRSKARRFLVSWGSFVIVMAIGIAFMGTLIHGILKGNETAHDLDHGDRVLDEHLLELADMHGVAPIAELPFSSANEDSTWDVVCYVDTDQWVGKTVATRLGLDVRDLTFDPRNIYVVDDYWGLAFLDTATLNLRIVEINRDPVAQIEGPDCLRRDGAEIAARPLEGEPGAIVVTFVGTPATPL